MKIDIINGLLDAGVKNIQVTSFVNPSIVPQMGDAEELVKLLPEKKDAIFSCLVLNKKGLERAVQTGLKNIEISVSASDTHSRRNTGVSRKEAMKSSIMMIGGAKAHGMHVIAGIQCSFGCVYEGGVPEDLVVETAKKFLDSGADAIALSDTTGMGNPLSVKRLSEKTRKLSRGLRVILHLHDTRGLGLANLLAGMESGITDFDTSLAGMGGCPFVPGASGNISTEDAAYMMAMMNIETGIDIGKVSACSLALETFLGKKFPGKNHRFYSKTNQIKET
jgi:hydroxymethylglutaryl-CoA lyase